MFADRFESGQREKFIYIELTFLETGWNFLKIQVNSQDVV